MSKYFIVSFFIVMFIPIFNFNQHNKYDSLMF